MLSAELARDAYNWLPHPLTAAVMRKLDENLLHFPKSARIDPDRGWDRLPGELQAAVAKAGGPAAVARAAAWTERHAEAAAAAVFIGRRSRWDSMIAQPDPLIGRTMSGPVILVHPHYGANNLPQLYLAARGIDMVSWTTKLSVVHRKMRFMERMSGLPVSERIEFLDVRSFGAIPAAKRALRNGKVFLWQPDSVGLVPGASARNKVSARMVGFDLHVPVALYELARRCQARVVIGHDTLHTGTRPKFTLTFEEIAADLSDPSAWYADIYRAVDKVLYGDLGQWRLLLGWIRTLAL